ncbi:MAG: CDP-alcohol phosphatidyltransferase family protein, partial [Anaerolineae bacterium]|nr:CDP-alcohol phosphatidyltransferase family protein [Anaerolineae bacterium]
VGTGVGALLVSQGRLSLGGLLIMLMGPIDALDGPVARVRGEPEDFGAFVDSVSDRYSELMIFAGLLWYFLQQGNWGASMLVFLAAGGSVLVSYVRARAQSLGFDAKVGILTRVERFLVIGPALLLNIPIIGVGIVAIGANITALQRVIYVRREARSR